MFLFLIYRFLYSDTECIIKLEPKDQIEEGLLSLPMEYFHAEMVKIVNESGLSTKRLLKQQKTSLESAIYNHQNEEIIVKMKMRRKLFPMKLEDFHAEIVIKPAVP